MNSSELASLAGVTVRALRHYHQVGVLDEPPRTSSGYRQYDVHDLIRVLRIRRLAALGISLEQVPALLDEGDGQDGGLLDQLDQEIAAHIDRLTAQRALIAHLQNAQAAPDIPPELAEFFAAHAMGELSPQMARVDRDHTVLLAHLIGAEGMPQLVRLFQRISDPNFQPVRARMTARFEELTDATADSELHQFVDEFVETLTPVVRELEEAAPDLARTGATALFTEYVADVLNVTQRRALDLIGARLDEIR